jgi:hypothetical protein
VKIPVGFVHNPSTWKLDNDGMHHAIVVVRRTIRKPQQDSLAIENQQHMIYVGERQRNTGFVLGQTIEAGRLVLADFGKLDAGGRFGRDSRDVLCRQCEALQQDREKENCESV